MSEYFITYGLWEEVPDMYFLGLSLSDNSLVFPYSFSPLPLTIGHYGILVVFFRLKIPLYLVIPCIEMFMQLLLCHPPLYLFLFYFIFAEQAEAKVILKI